MLGVMRGLKLREVSKLLRIASKMQKSDISDVLKQQSRKIALKGCRLYISGKKVKI